MEFSSGGCSRCFHRIWPPREAVPRNFAEILYRDSGVLSIFAVKQKGQETSSQNSYDRKLSILDILF